jgi:hypothetical protein
VDRGRDPVEYLGSGDAWRDFCRELAEAGAEVLRETAPGAPIDLAEGHRTLTRMLRAACEQIVEGGDAAKPWLFASLHETLKSGWDNPDNHHTNAYISGAYDYRYWQVHTNQKRAISRPDGSVRMVVSHRDPGLPDLNWLDTAGHAEGVWTVRWLEAASHPLPRVRVVRFADLGGA